MLDQLLSPNAYNQTQARRVLTERGPGLQRDLAGWTKAQRSEAAQLQAIWMYQTIDVVQPQLLNALLNAKDGRIRAAATRIVSYWYPRLQRPLDLLAARVSDEHPRVRLEAMRALSAIPTARSAELVVSVLDRPMDPFLDYGVWLSINDLAQPWIAAINSGAWRAEGHEKQLEFALSAIEPTLASSVLNHVLKDHPIARDGNGQWLELIGKAGDASLLRRVFDQLLRGGFDQPTAARALAALNDAAKKRGIRPSGSLDAIETLLSNPDPVIRDPALRLVGASKLENYAPQLLSLAADPATPNSTRQAVFDALRDIGGDRVMTGLRPLATNAASSAIQRQVVLTLVALDVDQAAQPAAALLLSTQNEEEALTLWRALLSNKRAGPILAHALPKSGLSPVMAKAGLRVAREGGRNEPDLVWTLTRGADLESEAQTLSVEELQNLAAHAARQGDPVNGELVFRRKELSCVTCHAIGGVGGKVGPDLTSIGASAQIDYLIESILYPNRKIKEGYHTVIVEAKDGTEYSGVLVSENNEQILLRDATNKENPIPKKDVQNRTMGNSIMPSGLLDAVPPAERLDLFRFLSELGKPGPFDASKGNVARFWKVCPETPDIAQFGDQKILGADLSDKRWLPASSLVDGRLQKEELAASLKDHRFADSLAIYAAARFEVPKSGQVSLKLDGVDSAIAWLDGKPLQNCADSKTELESGTHTFIVKLNSKQLPDSIRLESPDATFLTN